MKGVWNLKRIAIIFVMVLCMTLLSCSEESQMTGNIPDEFDSEIVGEADSGIDDEDDSGIDDEDDSGIDDETNSAIENEPSKDMVDEAGLSSDFVEADDSFSETQISEIFAVSDTVRTDDPLMLADNSEIAKKAMEILDSMTLREKICQMIIVNPEALEGGNGIKHVTERTEKMLSEYPIGGIMYKANNISGATGISELIENTQAMSKIELFIAVDEEGGRVARLMDNAGTTKIRAMYNYKDDGGETAYNNAYTIGSDMKALGFNLDFAPVCDVWSNPSNSVIGNRAYSDDFNQAAELIPYAVGGFTDSGVMCTLKHFPGHGNTYEDSHYKSAFVKRTREELEAEEFLPFKSGIDAGADFVMVGHLTVGDIDSEPAIFSRIIVNDILQEELGFNGIKITDSLTMKAITKNYSVEETAILAVNAGIDMLLEPTKLKKTVAALEAAVLDGTVSVEEIDDSVLRILIIKLNNGLSISAEAD